MAISMSLILHHTANTLRGPYFFCSYKRNMEKKIRIGERAFYKAALSPMYPSPPKPETLSGLTVGQGAPRPLPLPNSTCAGSAQPCHCEEGTK